MFEQRRTEGRIHRRNLSNLYFQREENNTFNRRFGGFYEA